MDDAPPQDRMPIAEDLDDAAQLRAALLDRDRRIVRLRTELVAMRALVEQLQGQVEELAETADNARSAIEHLAARASPTCSSPRSTTSPWPWPTTSAMLRIRDG